MKEFEDIFSKGFLKGLRSDEENPRNEEALLECHNWMPMEEGLEVHEQITSMEQS